MKLSFISILRSLSIIVVVFFHVYGYMYAKAHFPESNDLYHDTYFWINQCVAINIAMPMLILISGYLFDYLYNNGKYHEFWAMIKKKALRLFVPFILFSVLFMATTGAPFRPWNLYTGSYSHLWYLTTLFWCFPVAWVIKKYIRIFWGNIVILLVSMGLSTFGYFLPHFFGIQGLTVWFSWFCLGGILSNFQDRICYIVKRYHLVVPLIIPFCLQVVFSPIAYDDQTWYTVICVALLLIALWYLFLTYSRGVTTIGKCLIWFSKYSFGIYIFHNWIGPFLISSTAKNLFHLQALCANHVILFPLVLMIAVFLISWVITYAMLKSRLGRFLLG